jgi:hypothetical protein
MANIYFCLDGASAIQRHWDSVPSIGETIALPEFGGNLNPLRVYDVIWEGTIEPTVTIYVHHTKVEHSICNEQPRDVRSNGYHRERAH